MTSHEYKNFSQPHQSLNDLTQSEFQRASRENSRSFEVLARLLATNFLFAQGSHQMLDCESGLVLPVRQSTQLLLSVLEN